MRVRTPYSLFGARSSPLGEEWGKRVRVTELVEGVVDGPLSCRIDV